jgi:phosphoribosylpyrophosphate synthetase
VEPDNWDSVLVFLACQTQWKREFAGMEATLIWQGLDYQGVSVVIQMQGHKGQKVQGIFKDVQVMEQAALPILNKPPKRK